MVALLGSTWTFKLGTRRLHTLVQGTNLLVNGVCSRSLVLAFSKVGSVIRSCFEAEDSLSSSIRLPSSTTRIGNRFNPLPGLKSWWQLLNMSSGCLGERTMITDRKTATRCLNACNSAIEWKPRRLPRQGVGASTDTSSNVISKVIS